MTIFCKKTHNNASAITWQWANVSHRKLYQMTRKIWPVVIINDRGAQSNFQVRLISFSIAFTEPYSPLFWAYGYITHTSTLYSYSTFPSPAQDSGEKWKYIAILSSRYLLLLISKSDATFYTNFYFRNADVPRALDRWYVICTLKAGAHSIAW